MTLEMNMTEFRGLGPAVAPAYANRRLDQYLASTFPFNSRAEWKSICARGHLLVDGVPARATKRLRGGEKLAVYHPIESEPEIDDGVELISVAGGLMAVFKPGNLPMHESSYFRRHTLTAIVHDRFGKEWAPVHRLDRETSGVVLCAATPILRKKLSLDFESHAVRKSYIALVTGEAEWEAITVDRPIALSTLGAIPRMIVSDEGAPSLTDFRLLEAHRGRSMLEVIPKSGRGNQIRVHAAWLGHHIIGDKIYHADPNVYEAYARLGHDPEVARLAGFHRHALHATSVEVCHPETGKVFVASAELPNDMRELWRVHIEAPAPVPNQGLSLQRSEAAGLPCMGR